MDYPISHTFSGCRKPTRLERHNLGLDVSVGGWPLCFHWLTWCQVWLSLPVDLTVPGQVTHHVSRIWSSQSSDIKASAVRPLLLARMQLVTLQAAGCRPESSDLECVQLSLTEFSHFPPQGCPGSVRPADRGSAPAHVAEVSWRRRAPEHCFDWWALVWGFRIELPAMCHSEADASTSSLCLCSASCCLPPSSEWVSRLVTP